jgi:hypothetical protein
MPWTIVTPILIWAVIFIPLAIILWLMRPSSKLLAYLFLLDYAAASFFFVMTVNWSIINYYLRFLPALILLLLFIRQMRVTESQPFFPPKGQSSLLALLVAILLIPALVYVDYRVLKTFDYESYYKEDAILVYYPLRDGMYVVTNGGNGYNGLGMSNMVSSIFGEPSGTSPEQGYGADMMKLDIGGSVSQGIMPSDYRKYYGFNDHVYSPCRGKVFYVEDGHPNVQVGAETTMLGNYVILSCFEWYVTLSGFTPGSFFVKAGDEIQLGSLIGYVGNSAMPSIPHLRMYVTRDKPDESGVPVPILFELSYSARNTIFIP